MSQLAAAISALLGLIVFGTSVVMAVTTYERQPKTKVVTYGLRMAPYVVSIVPASYFWHRSLAEAFAAVVIFLLLTWGIIWGVRKQWGV